MINIGLPAVLFLTFIDMELKSAYFLVIVITFFLFCTIYLVGIGLTHIKRISHPLIPFVITGLTFGNIGIPLYTTVFGIENLSKYSILGIGHETFYWFVLCTLLKMKFAGQSFSINTIKGFLKSPFIIAVIAGIAINITGMNLVLSKNIIFNGVNITLGYLGSLLTPLSLIIVGFDLKFQRHYMKQSIKLVILRLLVVVTIGYIFKYLFLDQIIVGDLFFDYAYFTYLILPPPYSLPIFIGQYGTKEHANIATNTVVLSTVIFFVLFIIFLLVI